MKSNELRIGNLVYSNYGISEVFDINPSGLSIIFSEEIFCFDIEEFKPIPLTENCLYALKGDYFNYAGFGTRLIFQDISYPVIKIEKTKINWAFYFNDELISFKDYLHDAQNLYFSLTNKELQINKKLIT